MKLCANNSCTVKPSHGPEPTTMERSASGGCVFGAENVVSIRMSVSSRACEKEANRGSSNSLAKNGGTFKPDDGASVADLKLLGDGFELGENIVDVLEIMAAGIGQRERAHAALEQSDAQLLLERLDLMAHGGWSDEQSSAAALKLCSLAATWKVFRNLSDGKRIR